jgi:hypothetical protein
MLVFVSWAGPQSQAVATALHTWLRDVIQALEPWASHADIKAGARWSPEIAAKLQDTRFGVVVASPDNLDSRWLNFEAGACAKVVGISHVVPYLVGGLDDTQVTGPLAQFQMQKADPEGTWNLLKSLNAAVDANKERALNENQLRKAFEQNWKELEEKIKAASLPATTSPPSRSERELLEEILSVVRVLERKGKPPSIAEVLGAAPANTALGRAIVDQYLRDNFSESALAEALVGLRYRRGNAPGGRDWAPPEWARDPNAVVIRTGDGWTPDSVERETGSDDDPAHQKP